MIDAIGGRKVLVAIFVLAIAVGAVFLRGDVPANFLLLLQTVFGAFVVGNGIEHFAARNRPMYPRVDDEDAAAPAPPAEVTTDQAPVVPEALTADLGEIKDGQIKLLTSTDAIQQTLLAIIQRIWPQQ